MPLAVNRGVAWPDPPRRAWNLGEKLRVRGFAMAACGLPTAALADEILLGGKGQIKALITVGGNPMLAWPDQQKTFDAMNALELHVVVDPKLATAQELPSRAHDGQNGGLDRFGQIGPCIHGG